MLYTRKSVRERPQFGLRMPKPALIRLGALLLFGGILLQAADPAPPAAPGGSTVQKESQPTAGAETDPIKLAKPNALGEKIVGGAPVINDAYVIGAEDV